MSTLHRLGLLSMAGISLVATSCDCSNDSGAAPLVITSIEPLLFVAFQPVPFTVRGSGFSGGASAIAPSGVGRTPLGDAPTEAVITFHATEGTPFANGTSATAQVTGTVISDTEIRGASPVTGVSGGWECTVEVTAAFSSVTSTAPLAVFAGLTFFDIDREVILANRETPFDVFGFNFAPVNGSATVRFTSTVPGAFPGGSDTLDVQGTVVSRIRITGVTPAFALAGPVQAGVTVILDQEPNALPSTSSEVALAFLPPPPAPMEVNSITSPLPIGIATPFTITGSGFVGGGASVEVTFVATAGTPLFGGTASVASVLGTATSDTTVTGISPTGTAATDVTAFVRVTRSDGMSGNSDTAIALFTPPVETVGGFAPILLPVDIGTPFTVTGTNLPAPQNATVRFRALAGTPFAGGTAGTVDVTANITSATQIDGTSPLAIATAEFLAEVTVVLQSTMALPMGVVCVFVPAGPPPPSGVVTNLNDSGPGSLRDTILAAPAGSIVSFDPLLAGSIHVTSTILVPHSLHILGPGAGVIRVDAQLGDFPVFTIQAGATAAIVDLLSIVGSRHSGSGGGFLVQGGLTLNRCRLLDNEIGGSGGAVFVEPNATFAASECTFDDNSSTPSGGAVFLSSGVTALVEGCTFSGCWASMDGGVFFVAATATLSVVNSTFANNIAVAGSGGAVFVAAGATLNLLHCTLAFNSADHRGGGVFNGGTLDARNCIFRNSGGGGSHPEISNSGTNSTDHCLLRIGTGSGVIDGFNGNLVGSQNDKLDPELGPLQSNGGETETYALQPTSPAINAGTGDTPADQRGVPRPQGLFPDMGAYEATVVL